MFAFSSLELLRVTYPDINLEKFKINNKLVKQTIEHMAQCRSSYLKGLSLEERIDIWQERLGEYRV